MTRLVISRYNGKLSEHNYNQLRSLLSNSFKEKFDRVKDLKRKQFVAMEYIILKMILKKNDFEINVGKNGKPFVKGEKPFNISHSGEYLIVASHDKEIGVDIQKKTLFKEKLAFKICNKKEVELLERSKNKNLEFTKLWTKKESYIKMLGESIVQDLTNIDTMENPQYYTTLEFDDYIISLCSK